MPRKQKVWPLRIAVKAGNRLVVAAVDEACPYAVTVGDEIAAINNTTIAGMLCDSNALIRALFQTYGRRSLTVISRHTGMKVKVRPV